MDAPPCAYDAEGAGVLAVPFAPAAECDHPGLYPRPVQGGWDCSAGAYSLGAFLPPISPAGVETASGPAEPPFRAGRGHICRVVGKAIGGKLCLVHGILIGRGPAGHPSGPPRFFLERDEGAFHALACKQRTCPVP